MTRAISIGGRQVGPGHPVYVIAEISANHGQDIDVALRLMRAVKDAGADAVKFQTYTPDTMTIPSHKPPFRIQGGTLWDGRTLYELYQEAYTPWEWLPRLAAEARELGMDWFSSAFDATAVEFLEKLDMPVHKLASFELVDIPLIERMSRSGTPIIMSTGMATLGEIEEAVIAARRAGADELALLKCCSAYPAPPDEMHLRTIPHLAAAFDVPVGLSDHTLGTAVPVAAVALGAAIVEKHVTLSRAEPGPDSAFSLEPHEFKTMVDAVRMTEAAIGGVHYGANDREASSLAFRRSLFVVEDVHAGEPFTTANVRVIRPSHGLPPKYLPEVLGRHAACDIEAGTPLAWPLVH